MNYVVVRRSLKDMVDLTRPIYPVPNRWNDTIAYMQNDVIEYGIVKELLSVLSRGESFREPIHIRMDGLMPEGVESPYVMDGTHRMVAHILNGSEFIDVSFEYEDQEEEEPSKEHPTDNAYQSISTIISFPQTTENIITDNEYDELFSVLRSFKVSDELWVTCDVMSAADMVYNFTWNIEEAGEALMKKINDICIERVGCFLNIEPLSIITRIEYWD